MKVAVIGKGGREHAIVRALARSSSVSKVYAIPGNDGMIEAENIAISPSNHQEVVELCRTHEVGLVVVGTRELSCGRSCR